MPPAARESSLFFELFATRTHRWDCAPAFLCRTVGTGTAFGALNDQKSRSLSVTRRSGVVVATSSSTARLPEHPRRSIWPVHINLRPFLIGFDAGFHQSFRRRHLSQAGPFDKLGLSSVLPGRYRRTGFAPMQHGRPRVQIQAAFLSAEAVTSRATPQQDRKDVVLRRRRDQFRLVAIWHVKLWHPRRSVPADGFDLGLRPADHSYSAAASSPCGTLLWSVPSSGLPGSICEDRTGPLSRSLRAYLVTAALPLGSLPVWQRRHFCFGKEAECHP